MMASLVRRSVTALAALATILIAGAQARAESAWTEAYQSSPATYAPPSDQFVDFAVKHWHIPADALRAELNKQPIEGTVRYRIAVQAEGSQLRIRLSNENGTSPLELAGASVALAADGFAAGAGTLRRLTFGGVDRISVPTGSPVLSDPVSLPVKPGTELVVTISLATTYSNEGRGGAGFMLAPGDQTMAAVLPQGAAMMKGRPIVTGVSVLSETKPNVIVAFGDSITDGNRADHTMLRGWPEALARRLAARKGGAAYSAINAGIGGNRVLSPGWGDAGLARLDRDALRVEGITHLIVLEGINDINMSGASPFGISPELTAGELIGGYRQIIARAHERGIKVYFGTLTPNPGDALTSTPAKVAMRDAVNAWIRTSGEPDGVIDFDAMVRDPKQPAQFKAEFDSGDHLHPSERGYQAMGDGIDLSMFP